MEKNYVNRVSPLYPIIYSSENVIVKNDLKFKLDNTKKIFSLNQNVGKSKKFNSTFKSFFLCAPPPVSNVHEKERRYKCQLCEKSFTQKCYLKKQEQHVIDQCGNLKIPILNDLSLNNINKVCVQSHKKWLGLACPVVCTVRLLPRFSLIGSSQPNWLSSSTNMEIVSALEV